MNAHDSRLKDALQSSVHRIRTAAATSAARTLDALGMAALAAPTVRQRDVLLAAQFEFTRKVGAFNQRFAEVLNERVTHEVQTVLGVGGGPRTQRQTDWQSLSLVQDDEVEELVSADRLSQTISHECEWELRELATYMGSLLGTGHAEQDRNPLRPEIIGKALFRGVEAVSTARDTRTILGRELGRTMGSLMRNCYGEIVADLQSRGIQPVGLSVRGVEGPGNELPRELLRANSAYASLPRDSGISSRFDSRYDLGPGEEMLGLPSTGKPTGLDSRRGAGGYSQLGVPADLRDAGSRPSGGGFSGYGARGHSGYGPSGWRGEGGAAGGSWRGRGGHGRYSGGPVDPHMMDLIRRLAFIGSDVGTGDTSASSPGDDLLADAQSIASRAGGFGPVAGDGAAGPHSGFGPQPLSGLMAANLIRAHRQELREAATGALDHMVIDVVGSLFDQILSDPKVPPQMARQIARLQLPVLRVALGDVSFFSMRRHPVRRFVNRIASLACAFEDFSGGPGLELLTRVRNLVQEIVEGDFDQMELYESQLGALEDFIARTNEQQVQETSKAPDLLLDKEQDLRLQQRYMQQLKSGLATIAMPDFMREFISQVWSQTIMRAVREHGAQSDAAKRFRLAGRELIMSLQPKGSPTHRKQFLLKLPQLMKDLNEGMQLVGWPEPAKKAFFGVLLPAHAESLKGQPLSDLDYNLLASEIDTLLARGVPQAEEAVRIDPVSIPELTDVVLEHRFSPAEAEQIGLVPETAVDWDGKVDIEIGDPPGSETLAGADLDIDIDGLPPPDPPEPDRGRPLMDHVQIGFAYQMLLKDAWQKVRLSYVSPGRAFFVFTHGKRHQQTVSMTARMLARMCETNRLRPFEHAYLLERATVRARKQLAALGAAAKSQQTRP